MNKKNQDIESIEEHILRIAEQQTAITDQIRATIKTVIEDSDDDLEELKRLERQEQELIAQLPPDRQEKWRNQGYGQPAPSATWIDQVYALVKHC